MSFYLVTPPDVTSASAEDAALGLLGRAGMAAVRVADLAWPARQGGDGRSALTAAGAGEIRAGGPGGGLEPGAGAPAGVGPARRVPGPGPPAWPGPPGAARGRPGAPAAAPRGPERNHR